MAEAEGTAAGRREQRAARRAMAAIVVGFCAVGLLVQFIVRLDWGPDEPSHFEYVYFLAREHRLPTRQETHCIQHPPAYYVLAAGLWRLSGATQRPESIPRGVTALGQMTPEAKLARRLIRGLSTEFGAVTLLLLIRLLHLLELPWRWRPYVLLLAAGSPMLQYVSGVGNNELLGIAYSSLVCVVLLSRLKAGGLTVGGAAGLGALIGCATWIKQTTLFAAPLALYVMWVAGPREARWRRALVWVGAALAAGLWWPLHNHLAHGDWFPCFTVPQDQGTAWLALIRPLSLAGWLRMIAETCVLPDWCWAFLRREVCDAVAVALGGLYLWALLAGRRGGDPWRWRVRVLSALAFLALLAGVVHYCLFTDWRAQVGGRYLLNALAWMTALLAAAEPFHRPAPEQHEGLTLAAAVTVGLVLLFDAAWWYLAWLFYQSLPGG